MRARNYMASESDLRSRRDQALIVTEIGRDPEDRCVASADMAAIREKIDERNIGRLVSGERSTLLASEPLDRFAASGSILRTEPNRAA